MKKLLILGCVLLQMGCVNQNELAEPSSLEKVGKLMVQADEEIVRIQLPKDTFEQMSEEQLKETLQSDGAKDIAITNENVSYTISKSTFTKKVEQFDQQLEEMITQINEGDIYSSIKKINVNSEYTVMNVYVNRAAFEESFDRLAIFSLVTAISYINHYQGITDYTITVNYIDYVTNERYEQITYPELLD